MESKTTGKKEIDGKQNSREKHNIWKAKPQRKTIIQKATQQRTTK